jgi:uncharacterized protein (TIGR02996 family)
MTTTGDALLAAILADPEDDTARLVYADWLQEHGEADRAAFIRTQIEYARAEPFGREARAAEDLAHDLLNTNAENWKAWTDTVRDRVLDLRFERGFVTHIDAEPGAFLGHAEEIFANHPVRSLRLVPHSNPEYRAELAPVFGLACLRQLKRLAFAPGTEFLYDDYEALESSEYLAGLTDLAMPGSPIFPRWLEDVIRSEKFPALAGLDIADSSHLGPSVASALARADHRELRRLNLSRVTLDSDEMLQILHSPCLQRAEELRLGWSGLRPDDCGPLFHINIGWVIPWDRLAVLDVEGQRVGDEGVKEIVAKEEAAGLRWLNLANNWLTSDSVRLLAGVKHLRLNYLDVRRNLKIGLPEVARLKDRFPDAVVLG